MLDGSVEPTDPNRRHASSPGCVTLFSAPNIPTAIPVLVGISHAKGDAMVCEVCTIDHDTDPGEVRILDYRRWLVSPHPCPNCHAHSMERMRAAGARRATAMDRRILDALLKPKPCPRDVQSALRGELGETAV